MIVSARASLWLALAGLIACRGGTSTSDAAAPADALDDPAAEATPDVPAAADALAASDGAAPDAAADAPGEGPSDPNFVAIAPCATPAAYVETPRAVSTLAAAYSPACLRVPAGSRVELEASTVHPLEPRAGGSPGSPISSQIATANVVFPTPGFYPFLCPEHVDQG